MARRCSFRSLRAETLAEIRDALVKAGVSVRGEALVGGHATRYMHAPQAAKGSSGAKS